MTLWVYSRVIQVLQGVGVVDQAGVDLGSLAGYRAPGRVKAVVGPLQVKVQLTRITLHHLVRYHVQRRAQCGLSNLAAHPGTTTKHVNHSIVLQI